jgi:serine/threonine protein kinase
LQTRERRAELRTELSDYRERVETAEAALADDAHDDAVETARSVGDALDELATRVEDRELEGLAADVEDLRSRAAECESTARAERPGPPDAIPIEPDLALTHDALEVAEPIGKGGNADVYRATVDRDGRTHELALKEPRLSGTVETDVMDQFIEEARTWERLDDHDHVVGIVDYNSDPLPWIAMEYMDRGDLRDRIAEVDIREALWIATSVTDAVVHAHQRGISHLDLKPANVLFRSVDDDWPVPKVADWGLARMILEHSQTIEGLTPHYAAPEQLDEAYGSVDHATDVYQLGATFYELFVGQPPHTGEPVRVVRKTLDDPVTPPSELADVPPELDDILLRALAREKADRYDYLLHMHDDLASLLDEE